MWSGRGWVSIPQSPRWTPSPIAASRRRRLLADERARRSAGRGSGQRSASLPNVHHGDLIRVDFFPFGKEIEEDGRRGLRREQGRLDLIVLQQLQEFRNALQRGGAVIAHVEGGAVELGAPVDERRNPDVI